MNCGSDKLRAYSQMPELYPEIEPYQQDYLAVSELHSIYYEQVGNPLGKPVLFLHGGPGSGIDPVHRRFFDPEKYRIVLFDQRGSGKSKPYAELQDNTTDALVADIEKLRQHLGIKNWLIFGGSWGSTLALSYGVAHPESCTGMILRGIYLSRRQDINWFYQHGTHAFFPEQWQAYQNFIPEAERTDLVAAYRKYLNSPDAAVREQAAQHWTAWESQTMKLVPITVDQFRQPQPMEAFARIENHYAYHLGFFPTENYLLEQVHKIKHLPCIMIHGRYDMICSVNAAWELAQAWGEQARLLIIEAAGHSASEPSILSALVAATDEFKHL